MPHPDAERLEREYGSALTNAHEASGPAEEIAEIRDASKMKAHTRKREIARVVLEELRANGDFIRTEDGACFFFDRTSKRLDPLDGAEFRARLYATFGLNPTEDDTRFVEQELATVAMTQGQPVRVRRFAYWSDAEKQLYVDGQDGTMVILNGQEIIRADNSADGILFFSDRKANPIVLPADTRFPWSTATAPADLTAFHRLFEGLSLSAGEESEALSEGEVHQRHRWALALLQAWLLGVFFGELLPVRPLLALIGPPGSGKSSVAKSLGLALHGRDFEVSSFRSDFTGEQDFLATVTARRLVAFDNADGRFPWLPDHLAKLATGATLERRQLYTTNTLVSYRPDCFLILSTHTPGWKRPDVLQRLLPIRMQAIAGKKWREGERGRDVLRARPAIWAALLTLLNGIVATLQSDGGDFGSHHRLADFHWLGGHAARALGCEPAFEAGMQALEAQQLAVLADDDDRVAVIRDWLAANLPEGQAVTRTSQALYTELKEPYQGELRSFPFKNPTALGTWLGRSGDLLARHLRVGVQPAWEGHARAWKFSHPRCEGVNPPNAQDHIGNPGLHTFTPSSTERVEEESGFEESDLDNDR